MRSEPRSAGSPRGGYEDQARARMFGGWTLAVLALAAHLVSVARAQEGDVVADPPPPCSTAEARQFDFWIGEWDLTWEGGGPGTNVITSEMNGCVIREAFVDPTAPFHGSSVSVWNPNRAIWQQTWVDDQGGYLDFEGGMEGNRMILRRQYEQDGQTIHQRMVFYNIEENSLDWDWETSKDGGTSWDLAWRIHYERRNAK